MFKIHVHIVFFSSNICLFSSCVELAEIFFVDTTPFVQEYFTESEEHNYDWKGIYPPKTYISNLLKVWIIAFSHLSVQNLIKYKYRHEHQKRY